MSPLVVRRIWFLSALLLLSLAFAFFWSVLRAALRPTAIYTGALLLTLVLALALFNARKKLPFLPLLRAATWLQIHIYAGWFCLVLFLLHIQFRLPGGAFEITLALVFAIVVLSGFFGLYLSRQLPSRMARSGEPLLYERIPAFRLQIQKEVEALVREAERETESSTLGNFYVEYLRDFFSSRAHVFTALGNPDRKWHALLAETKGLDRYLNERERAIASEIRDWIETKQNLDFQDASQRLLKLWLFVHIPFTYSLIILGVVHGIVAMLHVGRW
ncbi:MAG: hypothetical protein ABIR21_07810 [Chthoniobacterales bacterium]